MKSFVILLYHGIYNDDHELAEIPTEDRPYAVSAQLFRQHLQMLKACGAHVISKAEIDDTVKLADIRYPVMITFDDGDKGWVRHALPALQSSGYEATFFVTSDMIGRMPHFCTWQDIKTLADAGMTIQSHGQTHRFLSDLPNEECRTEFKVSRCTLEESTGQPVTAISFPGGRFTKREIVIGRSEGFQFFHTSRVGLNRLVDSHRPLKRFAIRHDTTPTQLFRIVTQRPSSILWLRLVAALKDSVRSVVGNTLYHWVYKATRGRS